MAHKGITFPSSTLGTSKLLVGKFKFPQAGFYLGLNEDDMSR